MRQGTVGDGTRVRYERNVDAVVFVGTGFEETDLAAAAFFRRGTEEDDTPGERVEVDETSSGEGAGERGGGD